MDIKAVTENGKTVYYINAGSFTKSENAEQLKKQLEKDISQPITIKQTEDKKYYLVQIGAIDDYPSAQKLKDKLINPQANEEKNTTPSNPPAPASANITEKTAEQTVEKPLENPSAAPAKKIAQPTKLWNIRNGDIRAVIAEVSTVTGKNFVIDPRVQGKISIVSSTPMDNDALYQVFLSILQVSGYAAIPSGDIIKIIPNIDAKSVAPNALPGGAIGDDMLVRVIPVHYVPAEQLVPVLRPLMPQWSNVSAYGPSNMLILSGRANNIRRLADIIDQVDRSSANDIDLVPLHHSLAMDVVATLKELIKTQGGGAASGQAQIMVAADDKSNSIIITGNKTDRIRIRMLIAKLDRQNSNSQNSNTQVIYLHYLRAEDLAPIIAGVAQANFSGNVGVTIGTITTPVLDSTTPVSSLADSSNSSGSGGVAMSTSPLSSSTPSPSGSATPNTQKAASQSEGSTKPSVQIIAEPNTNSIIINAPSALIKIIKGVVAQLDIRPAQLLIEAMVLQVNESDVSTLGIEWGSTRVNGSNVPVFRNGFAIIDSQTSINDFQAQINALVTQNKANILSTPSVVVLDNRQAKILVGKQVSIAASNIPNNTAANGVPYTTFNRQNVALHLYVRPQITRGSGIQLQIDQGNDSLVSSAANAVATAAGSPTINISSIVTSVHVESGDIVVLGGLTQDTLNNNNNHLALLGDIPGVGRLFQNNSRTREKQVTMVFIKPIILRNEKDNFLSTEDKYNNLRQYQLDWLRSQQYVDNNVDVLLPNLQEAMLPKPFAANIQQVARAKQEIMMTK